MNKRGVRDYHSTLRDDQAEATARRIVEAAVRVLEGAPASLSIPAVARAAGVAVPTVYHHFGDKAALIRAVSDHLDRATGVAPLPAPVSPAALAEHVQVVFPELNGRHALMAPALRSPEGDAVRREQLTERSAMVRGALAGVASRLHPADFEKLVSVVTVLCTSETLGLLQAYLGMSGEDAGAAVAWAITRLCQENTA